MGIPAEYPKRVVRDVEVVPPNDVDALRATVAVAPDRFAAIVIDLLPTRAGLRRIGRGGGNSAPAATNLLPRRPVGRPTSC